MERFNLEHQGDVERESLKARPGCVLVAVRDVSRLWHLQKVLEKTNMKRHDIVVMTVRPLTPGDEYDLRDDQIFAEKEQHLFSKVVALAEKEGKTVELLVIPALDPFEAMVRTAVQLEASRLVVGVSARMASEELARRIGRAWERRAGERSAQAYVPLSFNPGESAVRRPRCIGPRSRRTKEIRAIPTGSTPPSRA